MRQILKRTTTAPPRCHAVSCVVGDDLRSYCLDLELRDGSSHRFEFSGRPKGGTKRFFDVTIYGSSVALCTVTAKTDFPEDTADMGVCEVHFVSELELPAPDARREYWKVSGVTHLSEDVGDVPNTSACAANPAWRKPTFDGYPDLADFKSEQPGQGFILADPGSAGEPAVLEWGSDLITIPAFHSFKKGRGLHIDAWVFDVVYKGASDLEHSIKVAFQKQWL